MTFEYVSKVFVIRVNRKYGAHRFEVCVPSVFSFSAFRTSRTAVFIKFSGGSEVREVRRFYFAFYAIEAFKSWIATRNHNPETEEIGGKTIEAYIRDQRETMVKGER